MGYAFYDHYDFQKNHGGHKIMKHSVLGHQLYLQLRSLLPSSLILQLTASLKANVSQENRASYAMSYDNSQLLCFRTQCI